VPALKRRNRIVVFRLTQDEYASLQNACVHRGARNISDFARNALLSSMSGDGQPPLDQRMTELESSVRQIRELLERIASQK
jgi:hypothetical protein